MVGVVLILGLLGLLGYGATNEEWRSLVWGKKEEPTEGPTAERDSSEEKESLASAAKQPTAAGQGDAEQEVHIHQEQRREEQLGEVATEEQGQGDAEQKAHQKQLAEAFEEKRRRQKTFQNHFAVALRKEDFTEAERYLDTLRHIDSPTAPKVKELERSLDEVREAVEQQRKEETARQRAKEQRISALLAAADQAFQANRLTTPASDNAWAKYGAVLELDPNNASAKQGQQRIEDLLQSHFDAALREEDFTEAERYLNTMRNIDSATAPRLKELERYLAEAREVVEQQRLDEVRMTAEQRQQLEHEQREGKKVLLSGGVEMEFVWIERGEASGGGFWLGRYEVMQRQWQAVMGTRPWGGKANVVSNPSHPAVYISWIDVQAFIRKLNGLAGNELYRLPTEAEWEYACRAGTTSRWSFGDDEKKLEKHAWYLNNTCYLGIHREKCHGRVVGEKHPNAWGLYDMYGNVAEFVQGSVARGGSIISPPKFTTSADRDEVTANHNNFYMGVRLLRVRDPPP